MKNLEINEVYERRVLDARDQISAMQIKCEEIFEELNCRLDLDSEGQGKLWDFLFNAVDLVDFVPPKGEVYETVDDEGFID